MKLEDGWLKKAVENQLCPLCGKFTEPFSADPNQWPLRFATPDSNGEVRDHHVKCVVAKVYPPKRRGSIVRFANDTH